MKKTFLFLAAVMLTSAARAISIEPENSRHYRKTGDTVKFNIQLDPGRANVKFRAWICGNKTINEAARYLVSDADGKAVLEIPAVQPGFIYVKIYDGKKDADIQEPRGHRR